MIEYFIALILGMIVIVCGYIIGLHHSIEREIFGTIAGVITVILGLLVIILSLIELGVLT